MISWIKGELVSSWQTNNKFYILINSRGLGYEIQTLESVISRINSNEFCEKEIILWLKHIKKEDSDLLFGFISKEQRDYFIEILNIKGVGSQIGMSLLNKFSLSQIKKAITSNDKKIINSVQGIGQKMTERIILELKSKEITKQIKDINNDEYNFVLENKEIKKILEDIDLTLQSLNYTKSEIKNLFPKLIDYIKELEKSNSENDLISFECLLKEAINYLNKQNSILDR